MDLTLIEDAMLISLNSNNAIPLNSTYNSNVLFNTMNIFKNESNHAYAEISVMNVQIPNSFYIINYTNNVLNYMILIIRFVL
jgi:hypothetical protein